MNEIEVKILKLSGLSQYADLLCSVYSDNLLLDAFTLDSELLEPIIFTVPSKLKQRILITVKSIPTNLVLGFAKFRLHDLLDPEFVLTLPISLPQDPTNNAKTPIIALQLAKNEVGNMGSKSENEAEFKRLRKNLNTYENNTVNQLRKIVKTGEKFGKRKKYLKKMLESPFEYKQYRSTLLSDEFFEHCLCKEREEKELIREVSELEVEIVNNKIFISSLKAQGLCTAAEIEANKRYLKIEQMKGNDKSEKELQEEVEELMRELQEKEEEIELFDQIAKDSLSHILYLQESNLGLRKIL